MNRAGRFDRAYEIPLPDEALRLQYLRQRGFTVFAGEEGTIEAARLTDTFSLAQLGELYVSAALEWHQNGQTDIVKVIQSMRGELDKAINILGWRSQVRAVQAFIDQTITHPSYNMTQFYK